MYYTPYAFEFTHEKLSLIFIGVNGAEREVLSWCRCLSQHIEERRLPAPEKVVHLTAVTYALVLTIETKTQQALILSCAVTF